ncbi:hypothetical protein D5S17_14600 [Pseudonocardiaceae bacterium YIM PH 21723]|nr:hypothetical protein D5S17_14600 [Pseudonocardiaceae bacterium YIM PH 21723]
MTLQLEKDREEKEDKKAKDSDRAANDYTESILQQGVKEPITLFVVRVVFADGTSETYLMAGDGNSRLASMWLARTGGDVDQAAEACVSTVIGPRGRDKKRRPADRREARKRVGEMAARVRLGLAEAVCTEATRREGHTLTVPAVVIVGAKTDDGLPVSDLLACRDDLVASLHVNVTPWVSEAQYDQGMRRVYRRALKEKLISTDYYRVLCGLCSAQEMHEMFSFPPHRLWSAALHQQVVLSAPHYIRFRELIMEEFVLRQGDRLQVGARLGTMALAAYRKDPHHAVMLNAFKDGGPITNLVWRQHWSLTKGANPLDVLDQILDRALNDQEFTKDENISAKAELTVLGGTAAIIDGLLTRERGSKKGTTRAVLKTPYRLKTHSLLSKLAQTSGGLKMLHSIAKSHVAQSAGVRPKLFHTMSTEINGRIVHDGDPVIDQAGAQATIELEWDLFAAADPIETAQELAASQSEEAQTTGSQDVFQRAKLAKGADEAFQAVKALHRMPKDPGSALSVFGSPESLNTIRKKLTTTADVLLLNMPVNTGLASDLDEDE